MSRDSRIKVYELARILRMTNKKMITILHELDISATGHMSRLCRRTDIDYLIDMIRNHLKATSI